MLPNRYAAAVLMDIGDFCILGKFIRCVQSSMGSSLYSRTILAKRPAGSKNWTMSTILADSSP